MTFNPGGPGESGVALASAIHSQLPDQMQRKFDFVAWDPRGIGASTPQLSGCGVTPPPEPANPYDLPATGPVDWRAYTQSYVEATAPVVADCYERNLDVAPYLGTWQVIHDLDAMREALGEEQWTYWGMSYGTRIGYWYAREFPDRLRAFALDGSWPANMGLRTWAGMDTWSFAYATEQFGSQFGKKMPAKFDRVLRASKMKRALETLAEEPDISGSYTIYMINCSDLDGRPSLDSVVAMAQSADENNSVYAGSLVTSKGTLCSGLPESMVRKPANIGRPYALPSPPVIINSIGDTGTPWLGGKQISGYLAGSTFITYEGTQHVTYLQTPSTCVNDTVTTYFLTAVSPGGTRSCDYAPSPGS